MIGLGVIGYGYWGPNLARAAAETEACRLVAIADRAPTALARAARRHAGVGLHEDWRALLDDPAVEAVLVATPAESHFEIALAALRAGRHVLVEKPLATSAEQCRRLVEEARRRQRVLMVDHTFVYTGAVQAIARLVAGGELGELFYYDSQRVNLGLFQRDVNVVWDLAVHDLSILDFLIGEPPVSLAATGTGHISGSPENMAHLTLRYASGLVAHLNVNWLAPVKVRQTLIGGSRRMILWDDLEPSEKVKVYDRGVVLGPGAEGEHALRISYRTGDMWAPQLPVREALLTELEHFAACIATGATPMTPGESGLRVVEQLECASASLRARGQPIDLQPMRRAS